MEGETRAGAGREWRPRGPETSAEQRTWRGPFRHMKKERARGALELSYSDAEKELGGVGGGGGGVKKFWKLL